MGGCFITGGKYGWVLGSNSTGEVFGLPFNSYLEVSHFYRFFRIQTSNNRKLEFHDVYNDWVTKYYVDGDAGDDFLGDIDDFGGR